MAQKQLGASCFSGCLEQIRLADHTYLPGKSVWAAGGDSQCYPQKSVKLLRCLLGNRLGFGLGEHEPRMLCLAEQIRAWTCQLGFNARESEIVGHTSGSILTTVQRVRRYPGSIDAKGAHRRSLLLEEV